jgi:hypothetical protein
MGRKEYLPSRVFVKIFPNEIELRSPGRGSRTQCMSKDSEEVRS